MPLQINIPLQTAAGYDAAPGTFVDLEIITRQLIVSIVIRYYKNQTAFNEGKAPDSGMIFINAFGAETALPARYDYQVTPEEWNEGTTAAVQDTARELIEAITGPGTVSTVNY